MVCHRGYLNVDTVIDADNSRYILQDMMTDSYIQVCEVDLITQTFSSMFHHGDFISLPHLIETSFTKTTESL